MEDGETEGLYRVLQENTCCGGYLDPEDFICGYGTDKLSGTNTLSLIGNFTELNLLEDMLLGEYFLFTQQGLTIYQLSSLLPGVLHNVSISSPTLSAHAVPWIKGEMGKREDLTSVLPSVNLWVIHGMSQGFQGNLFTPYF